MNSFKNRWPKKVFLSEFFESHATTFKSRDEWKRKAMQRSNELREQRKTRKRHQAKIAELKAELTQFKSDAVCKKKN